jgi:hypothetical protein
MHRDHQVFIAAIRNTKKIRLQFFSKEDKRELIRTCAPLDFSPSRRAKDQSDRYHCWNYDSDVKRHTLSLLPIQVISITELNEVFDPTDIVTWTPSWTIARPWGVLG